MDLSIIIVNYNTKDYLSRLLPSVKKACYGLRSEVFVVDNASHDGSPQLVKRRFPWVKLIALRKNLGFAKANNRALKRARGRYLLLLNSDTKVFSSTFFQMIEFMEKHPRAGLATCRVELEGGELDPACHRGFPTPWAAFTYFAGLEELFPHSRLFAQYHQGWKDLSRPHQIDSPSGAFFFLRRQAFLQVGLLDERFFLYGEDLDYAYRLKQAGWQVWYYPGTKIIHYKKRSGRLRGYGKKITQEVKKERLKAIGHFYDTMKLFYQKHYLNRYPRPVYWLVVAGSELFKLTKQLEERLR